ncbi:MAG: hypothetical protein K2W88_21320 [Pararheinheimera sp.]|nr:hypothetical protein [Rheinheimera sp.]
MNLSPARQLRQTWLAAVKAMPNAPLIRFTDLVHSPHIQDPQRFHQQLIKQLQAKSLLMLLLVVLYSLFRS